MIALVDLKHYETIVSVFFKRTGRKKNYSGNSNSILIVVLTRSNAV